jgi:hypothetical protein
MTSSDTKMDAAFPQGETGSPHFHTMHWSVIIATEGRIAESDLSSKRPNILVEPKTAAVPIQFRNRVDGDGKEVKGRTWVESECLIVEWTTTSEWTGKESKPHSLRLPFESIALAETKCAGGADSNYRSAGRK